MSLTTTVDAIADALVAKAGAVSGITMAYKWGAGPAGFNAPAATVGLPTIDRTGVDLPEDHIGQLTYRMEFQVHLFFDASEISYSGSQSLDTVAAFIAAVDADLSLGNTCLEAKVTHSEPQNVEGSRPLFAYACTVGVLAFV